jgi:hypothetical protein
MKSKSPKKNKKSRRSKNNRKSLRRSKNNRKSLRRSRSKNVKSVKACIKSTDSKYLKRPGPPYPAQDCKRQVRMGNDTLWYASKKDKNGIYRWKKIDKKWNVPD